MAMTEPAGLDCAAAEMLAGRICAAAGFAAQSDCQLLGLIAEFDAGNAVRWWDGVRSLAHWLAWACSMSAGTAREHVRVARALPKMPAVRAAFREGRLSYSKVREVTRVVGAVDEAQLCELALTATAAQLAKTVAGYRSAAGTRIRQQRDRGLSWTERESRAVDFRVRLPKEEAAVLLAALAAAQDQFGAPPADATPAYTSADALLDVARAFLVASPEDRSGEDRSLVVVQVGLDQLVADHPTPEDPTPEDASGGVAAGAPDTQPPTATPCPDSAEDAAEPEAGVPAGTPAHTADPTCQVTGIGSIEPETARRIACDADLLGSIIDAHGNVLALGRTRRLVSRAQRRALMIRDRGMCQFTGCHQSRHLRAHHLVHWADGGPTDLDNLMLLCQFHHTAVHEGAMMIRRVAEPGSGRRWEFRLPDGRPHRDWYSAEGLLGFLAQHADRQAGERRRAEHAARIEAVTSFHHRDAQRIQPGWRGERFDRHEAVQALFRMQPRPVSNSAHPQAQAHEAA